MIATGVVVASPVIVAGAVTAAVTVLPPLGIYKLAKRLRTRRQAQIAARFPIEEPFLAEPDLDDILMPTHATFPFNFHGDLAADEIVQALRERLGRLAIQHTIHASQDNDRSIEQDFPLSIFADMDIEHLFTDDDSNDNDRNNSMKSPVTFRTCPTTPALPMRKGYSRSLNNLLAIRQSSIHQNHIQ
jgi:hypothetical protein